MQNLVPIGRFSQICRLTVKALRLYDEMGLLRPAMVDADTGYRYYSLAQAADAEQIQLLRSLEVPLDEIQTILTERDAGLRRAWLDRHRERIEARIAGHQRVLNSLRILLSGEGEEMDYEIKIRTLEAQPMVSIRTRTSLAELAGVMGRAYGELYGYLGELGVRPAGPPLVLYHDPEFKEDDLDVEIGVPASERVPSRGSVITGELPAGTVAYTMHPGPYGEIGAAYRAVLAWMQTRGHESAGPPREVYLVGPGQAESETEYRTELNWPIR